MLKLNTILVIPADFHPSLCRQDMTVLGKSFQEAPSETAGFLLEDLSQASSAFGGVTLDFGDSVFERGHNRFKVSDWPL